MTLSLPADLEAHADGFDQMRGPGVYALTLDRPDDLTTAWKNAYDVQPDWFDRLCYASRAVYVGAASDVLARLENHRDGDVRQAALLRVCSIDSLYTVWWHGSADEAFERESRHALTLQSENPEWYVHQR